MTSGASGSKAFLDGFPPKVDDDEYPQLAHTQRRSFLRFQLWFIELLQGC
jgi:hypothetical protein